MRSNIQGRENIISFFHYFISCWRKGRGTYGLLLSHWVTHV